MLFLGEHVATNGILNGMLLQIMNLYQVETLQHSCFEPGMINSSNAEDIFGENATRVSPTEEFWKYVFGKLIKIINEISFRTFQRIYFGNIKWNR